MNDSGDSKCIHTSAPGKVILFGEHAVVYGIPAIASAVNLRTHVKLRITTDNMLKIRLRSLNDDAYEWKIQDLSSVISNISFKKIPEDLDIKLMKKLWPLVHVSDSKIGSYSAVVYLYYYAYFNKFFPNGSGLMCEVGSDLPSGAGLGSSAAFCVSLASAFLLHASLVRDCPFNDSDLNAINKWAFVGEKIIHGSPSGIDNCISTFGGAVLYKDQNFTQVPSFPELSIAIVNTKVKRSTKTLVAQVRERHGKYGEIIQPLLNSIHKIVDRSQKLFEQISADSISSHYESLRTLCDINHYLLNALGVGHTSLDSVRVILDEMDVASKLTGAGGGGCVIAYLSTGHLNPSVRQSLENHGFTVFITKVGCPGVCASP